MRNYFSIHPKINMEIPKLDKAWNTYAVVEKEFILAEWEKIRGTIPDKVKTIELQIENKLIQLNDEEDFLKSCQINDEICELASIINELWIYYRNEGFID